jgi:exodeoxyribonuclease V alpha subunit
LSTRIARGETLVVVIAEPRAVAIAVKVGHQRRRWSRLRDWMVKA